MRKTREHNAWPRDENSKPIEIAVADFNALSSLGHRRTLFILRDSAGNMKLTDMLAAAYMQGMTDMAISVSKE